MIIDLHTHTYFSDGELGPHELARRAEHAGYQAIGVADHVDPSNIETTVPALVRAAREWNVSGSELLMIPGAELTHVPPSLIDKWAKKAKELGAFVVVVHGETVTECVAKGTNDAALESKYVDILAHPGMLTIKQAQKAAEMGVALELTSRKGHALTNGLVGKLAELAQASLVINSDTHTSDNLHTEALREQVVLGCGLQKRALEKANKNSSKIVAKALEMWKKRI